MGILSAASGAVGLVTGGNVTRLATTVLLAASLGGWGAWQVQQWRWTANTARDKLEQARSTITRAEKLDTKRIEAANNTTEAEQNYEEVLRESKKFDARSASVRAGLERVLNTASACTPGGQAVRNGQPARRFDAADARWQLERRGPSAD